MAFDPELNETVLLGGTTCGGGGADAARTVWLFDGTRWRRDPSEDAAPPKLAGIGGLVYDQRLKSAVYLGYPAAGGSLQSWAFNGTRWRLLKTVGAAPPEPTARQATQSYPRPRPFVTYEARLGEIALLQPGLNHTERLWLFDGSRWHRGPLPRLFADGLPPLGFAYDPAVGRVVLVGLAPAGRYQGQVDAEAFRTWLFDGNRWTESGETPGLNPSQPLQSALTYPLVFDTELHGLVLVKGPYEGDGSTHGRLSTWLFKGNAWRKLQASSAPVARDSATAVYDSQSRTVVLYGGQTPVGQADAGFVDTLSFDGSKWGVLDGASAPQPIPVRACKLARGDP